MTCFEGARREVSYLCSFNSHVKSFEGKKADLAEKRRRVLRDVEDAKKRSESGVDDHDQSWLNETDVILKEDTEARKKWFHGWCPDCIWQYRQGKKWAKKKEEIEELIRYYLKRLPRQAPIQETEYHSRPSFIHFQSRRSEFEKLVEALENGNDNMIGLQGLGGIGKTTLAQQVGIYVEETKAFQKVIITSVSDPPDIYRIQVDIGRQLELSLEHREEADWSKVLWSRISNCFGRLLIILDNVWNVPSLEDIGIPFGNEYKNCCVLIISSSSRVCIAMGCQPTIHLQTLTDQDALNLFMTHACDDDLSRNDMRGIANHIVEKCGGLPLAIVAMARTLRNKPIDEWELALRTVWNSLPSIHVDEELENLYYCLKLSYDYLRDKRAKDLFLLCSLFPEAYEIPLSLLIRLGIGAGIFGQVDEYCEARNQVLAVRNELVDSSLLLKAEKECVKMHDLFREVARWIAEENTQVIMNSKVTPKSNLRFLFWSGDGFPNQFHATKLEVLLLWIKGYAKVEDANSIFDDMRSLRVLFLCCDVKNCLGLPLQSFLLLKNIRTLILDGWKLDDISILDRIKGLETLELNRCTVTKLPREIEGLKKLKLLGIRGCCIEMNNPFEVIARCSQLEELYFVDNYDVKNWKSESDKDVIDSISPDISPHELQLQMYSIACSGFEYFDDGNGLSKCFNTKHVKHLVSRTLFQHLLEKAEVLELRGEEGTGIRILVPDIIPTKNGAMNNLIKLSLCECDSIEYLVDSREILHSDVTVFSKLVELHVRDVALKWLYRGPPLPPGSLEQLQVLELWGCIELEKIFLEDSLKLPHLEVLKLGRCPMIRPSIFKRSDAASLAQLEELVIVDCNGLSSLIAGESLEEETVYVDHQNSYAPLFPRLKTLKINGCQELKLVSPQLFAGDLPLLQHLSIRYCGELKYIFDHYHLEGQFLHEHTMLPSLTKINLYWVPNLTNILRRCKEFWPPIVKDDSKKKHSKMQQHTISLGSPPSWKGNETLSTAECLLRSPFGFQNIRHMKLWEFSNIRSLFSISIAATIRLETLRISYCEELRHIITNEGEDLDHKICRSIFPELQVLEICNCSELKFIFPSTFSGGLQKLEHVTITEAPKLELVFGKYNEEDYLSNDGFHIDLPSLKTLSLEDVPSMVSICPYGYLQNSYAPKTTKMHMLNVTGEGANKSEIIEEIVSSKYGLNFDNLGQITIRSSMLETLFSKSTWKSLPQLSMLCIWDCNKLRNVVEDDYKEHGHINYSYIFPKLEDLDIRRCSNLEFIFPSPAPACLPKLKHLDVREAPKLKYIFGEYYDATQLTNENVTHEVQVDLSALETLSLTKVPNMINICATKHTILRLPSLRSISLDYCQELSTRPYPDLTLYWKPAAAEDLMSVITHQRKLTSLVVEESIIEEIFNFEEYGEVEGAVTLNLEFMMLMYLRELRYICRGHNDILSLFNLKELIIESCLKLRVIFSSSMSKSLPQLSDLRIKDCPELLHLIEEDDHLHQQHCFPKLECIDIEHCNSLKCLFSISKFNTLPRLWRLSVVGADQMEQVFTCKQFDMQEMEVKHVLPTLSSFILKRSPNLVAVCRGINFQTVDVNYAVVEDCPKYREISPQLQPGSPSGDSENEAATGETPSASHSGSDQEMPHKGETSLSPKFSESSKEATEASVEVPISKIPSVISEEAIETSVQEGPTLKISSVDLEDEQTVSEAPVQLQHQDRGEAKTTTKVPHKANIPFDDDSIGLMLNERVQEGLTTDDVVAATLLADLAARNSSGVVKSIEGYKETEKEVGKVASALKLTTSPKFSGAKETVEQSSAEHDGPEEVLIIRNQSGVALDNSLENEFVESIEIGRNVVGMFTASQTSVAAADSLNAKVASKEGTLEQGFEKHDTSKEAIMAIQSANSESRKQYTIPSDIKEIGQRKETKKVTQSATSFDLTKQSTEPFLKLSEKDFEQIVRRMTETIMKQDLQENYALGEATRVIQSPSADVTKQYTEPFLKLSQDSAQTIKETTDASVEEIPQSQIGSASTSSSSILEIGEILELVELKDEEERALLVRAIEQYPQLRLSCGSRPIITFAYRVLVDILNMLSTKNPYTMTEANKSTLKENLGAANYFGFDKDWVESVRAKVFDIDMVDVLTTREKILNMEAELEAHDSALAQMRKERAEAKERLATARRQLETAQSEFEAVDSQLLGLLVDCKKLITKMEESGEISDKDGPFGI